VQRAFPVQALVVYAGRAAHRPGKGPRSRRQVDRAGEKDVADLAQWRRKDDGLAPVADIEGWRETMGEGASMVDAEDEAPGDMKLKPSPKPPYFKRSPCDSPALARSDWPERTASLHGTASTAALILTSRVSSTAFLRWPSTGRLP
jgi:hypothetical protein